MRRVIGRIYGDVVRYARGYLLGDRVEREAARWFRDRGDESLRVDYPLDQHSTVLDCGGYKGDWAAEIHERYKSRVFVFEPVGDFYSALCTRFAAQPNVQVFNVGLHARDETKTLRVAGDASSLFATTGSELTVRLRDVVGFLDEHRIKRIDLMKINIEGGEFDLLERMLDAGIVDIVSDIQVQFHRFVPDSIQRRQRIRDRLSKSHRLSYDYEFVWENWRRL